jgi:prepilin-type N-terminal cleavage/methylation domain-containing protein
MKRLQTTEGKPQSQRGFTLIELLVSMTILVIITLMVARIFQQAGVAWDTGSRKAEKMMAGRAVSDFLAQQLSYATPNPDGSPLDITMPLDFFVLGDASAGIAAIQNVKYSASQLADGLSDSDIVITTTNGAGMYGLPLSGVVTVTISNNVFQTGFYFAHRDRNRL